jgi:2'-5' RNA ligase
LVDKYQDREIQKLAVKELILYESILSYSGAVYKPLFKVELRAGHI